MRASAVAMVVALSACATLGDRPSNLRGCWLAQRGEETLTMRWLPGQDSSWRGELSRSAPGAAPELRTYSIDETITVGAPGTGWMLCDQGDPANPDCLELVFGQSNRDGRAEIVVTDETLRVIWNDDGPPSMLFDGRRVPCD